MVFLLLFKDNLSIKLVRKEWNGSGGLLTVIMICISPCALAMKCNWEFGLVRIKKQG